jgi:hypothetical protein
MTGGRFGDQERIMQIIGEPGDASPLLRIAPCATYTRNHGVAAGGREGDC